jgi:type II secretory pathway pseudopilin PulG
MIVVMVLLILIGVMATVVQTSYHGQKRSQVSTQAYYTARSVSERITDWLEGTPNDDTAMKSNQQKFIDKLKNDEVIEQSYSEADLDPSGEDSMGRAEAEVSINANDPDADQRNTIITVKVTGYFADDSETIVSTLKANTNTSFTDQKSNMTPFEGGAFDPDAEYKDAATALNNLPSYNVMLVGDLSNSESNASTNAEDLEKVRNISKTENTEVMWRSGKENDSNDYSTVQGTRTVPDNSKDPKNPEEKTDKRRLVAAKNGRFLINPIQIGGHDTESYTYEKADFSKPAAEDNTRFNFLSVDTANATDNGTRNIKVRIADKGQNHEIACNAVIGLDFVDIKGSVVKVESDFKFSNLTGTRTGAFEYRPIDWDSCDIFVPSSADLGGTNLIFGMFGHKFKNRLDYQSHGNYVNKWIGLVPGEFDTIYPEADPGRSKQYGLHNIPVTYDKTRIWCLDGDTDRYLRILQGVSVIDGAVYSNRSTIIGGGIISTSDGGKTGEGGNRSMTTDNINNSIDGYLQYSRDDKDYSANYVVSSVMYDQVFKNTDFIFKSNGTTSVKSEIRRPNTWQDRPNQTYVTAKAKDFNPKMLITGGSIYVGNKQSLTIQGASINNMMIAPSSLTVDSGGALVIASSSHFNINTDMFIGGKATISSGAKVRGNIVVGKDGVVDLGGTAQYIGDIYIEEGGKLTIGQNAVITGDIQVFGDGELTIRTGANITGDVRCAGTLNIEGGITINYLAGSKGADNPYTPNIDESKPVNGKYIYHGIFIYNDQNTVKGVLNITGTPTILGNSGKIHSFAGYPGIEHASAGNTFCDKRAGNNVCEHWTSESSVWMKQGDSANE